MNEKHNHEFFSDWPILSSLTAAVPLALRIAVEGESICTFILW